MLQTQHVPPFHTPTESAGERVGVRVGVGGGGYRLSGSDSLTDFSVDGNREQTKSETAIRLQRRERRGLIEFV